MSAAIDLLGGVVRRATRVRGFASWRPQRETLAVLIASLPGAAP